MSVDARGRRRDGGPDDAAAAAQSRRPLRRCRRRRHRFPGWGCSPCSWARSSRRLNGRLSTFGLADIRGAVHAGFDEGAWITTAQTVGADADHARRRLDGQRLRSAAGADGRRARVRADLPADAVLAERCRCCSCMQFLGGLASGCFIPLTLSFILLQHAAAILGLRHRALCAESRAFAQYLRVARGLVRRTSLLALDLLAERAARADHALCLRLGMRVRAGSHRPAAHRISSVCCPAASAWR